MKYSPIRYVGWRTAIVSILAPHNPVLFLFLRQCLTAKNGTPRHVIFAEIATNCVIRNLLLRLPILVHHTCWHILATVVLLKSVMDGDHVSEFLRRHFSLSTPLLNMFFPFVNFLLWLAIQQFRARGLTWCSARTRCCHSIIFDSICVVLVCHSLFHFLSVLESLHRKYDRNLLVVHMWTCHQRADAKTRDEKERKHAKMWMGSVQKFRAFAENKQFISSFSTSACWHVRLDEIVNTFYHILIISLVLRCEKGVWNREPFFFEKGLCFKKRAHIEVKSRGSRAA